MNLVKSFPPFSIKTCYIPLNDHRQYDQWIENESLTTPLHMACLTSNFDAIKFLMGNNYDFNILLNGKSAVYTLLKNEIALPNKVLSVLKFMM